MNAGDYWQLFVETGAPEAYLMYSRQLKTEENNVLENPGDRPACYRLQ